MNKFNEKFKLIFVPFFLIGALTIAGYTFLHWLLCIKTTIVTVDEDVTNFFIPFALPWIPMLIWLMPKLKLLNLKNKSGKGDPLMGYLMVAWFAIGLPTIIAQEYLITATGTLTSIDNIGQINQQPLTKYYTLKHYYIDKRLVRVKPVFEVSGKYNEHFDMSIYAPCPIYDKNYHPASYTITNKTQQNRDTSFKKIPANLLIIVNGKPTSREEFVSIPPNEIQTINVYKGAAAVALYGDAAKNGVLTVRLKTNNFEPLVEKNMPAPLAWLAVKYQKTISNRLSSQEKDDSYKQFAKKSQDDFSSKQLEDFVYLDRIGAGKDLRNYIKAVKLGASDNIPLIILSPVNEPFASRNGSKLPWIFGSFGIGAALFLMGLLFKPLKSGDLVTIAEKERKRSKLDLQFFKIFWPQKTHFATSLIIDINLAIFIIMALSGLGFMTFSGDDLLKLGANYRPYVIDGQYWRLITNMFLHGGFMHVFFNMYGLLFVGIFLEPLLGRNKFVLTYLITGIIASFASILWHPNTVSVGASGAIFGMYGIFFALLTTSLFPKDFQKSFLISTSFFIGYNLLYGLTGGIDNAAHIGGLVSGFVIGYILYPGLKSKSTEKDTEQLLDELTGKKKVETVDGE
ncbi:rhomboid family intramembrane serine protease [Mucilaginibacter sp. dw_454]|uniref:rhomboid family intramembrane serine protease n=1 Tax=Mucilaginibacter sp. dw_454 TaxID=2720079 RepID=UPI001BD472B8|nr:rhomboid family intramembrane serine protease [Mucilaginibacter sp. dw_454]